MSVTGFWKPISENRDCSIEADIPSMAKGLIYCVLCVEYRAKDVFCSLNLTSINTCESVLKILFVLKKPTIESKSASFDQRV